MSEDPRPDIIDRLVGAQLVSVTFIWDYMQFEFEGLPGTSEAHGMNIYAHSNIRADGKTLSSGELGYRDALCERIGATVRAAGIEIDKSRIAIEFDDGALFTISLRSEDIPGPEAAEYVQTSGRETIVHAVWQNNWKEQETAMQ